MSFIVCPLCGKMSSLRKYDPHSLDVDIYLQKVKGLGRGRGFKVVSKSSALGDPSVIEPIKNRLIDLLMMLKRKNLLSGLDLAQKFGGKSEKDLEYVRGELATSRAELKNAQDQRDAARRDHLAERAKLKMLKDDYSNKVNSLSDRVIDLLDEDVENWVFETNEEGEGSFSILENATDRLIEEFSALRALSEER